MTSRQVAQHLASKVTNIDCARFWKCTKLCYRRYQFSVPVRTACCGSHVNVLWRRQSSSTTGSGYGNETDTKDDAVSYNLINNSNAMHYRGKTSGSELQHQTNCGNKLIRCPPLSGDILFTNALSFNSLRNNASSVFLKSHSIHKFHSYSRNQKTRNLQLKTADLEKDHQRSFKSSALQIDPPPNKYETKTDDRLSKPPPQSLGKLLSLANAEKWTLAGGITLLGVSSAVTMSVPFIVGTLIDTIYGGGHSDTAGAIVSLVDTMTSSAPAIVDTAPAIVDTAPAIHDGGTEVAAGSAVAGSNETNLKKLCGFLAGVFVVGGAANCGRVYLMTTAGQRISQTLRSRVFASILRQETAYFDRHKTGEMVSRLAADTPLVATAVTSNVADAARSVIMAVAAVSMMVYTSPQLAMFGLAVVPPIAIVATYSGRKLRGTATSVQELLAVCMQHAEERLSNVRTVRVFAQEEREVRRQDVLLTDTLTVMYREARIRAAFFGFTGLSGNMIVLSVLYKGNSLVSSGLLSVGSLSAFLMYAAYVGISVTGVASAYSDLSKGAGAADRLFELMDRKPLMPLHGGLQVTPAVAAGAVEFKGVTFAYPTRPDAPVFSGLDLKVPTGRVMAVVGASGCGKSSVVSLLLRLYDPQQGAVLLDGRDITAYDPASLRAAIGVVTQDPVLFSDSIRSNLLYGAPDPSSVTDDQLEDAAHQANALDFVRAFPDGFSTVVGERGVLLSGGQRQRLAIARALITDPAILCLDEATSALDSESEHLVQQAIERLMRGRTVITIAHRLSTIRTADQIAVLQDGKVAELGSYAELMQVPDGVFRRLVGRQAVGSV